MEIRARLEEVSKPGTDPIAQASVIGWAMQFQGSYFQTRRGNLRRVFPKATETVLFHGVPQSKSAKAMLAHFSNQEEGEGDADHTEEDAVRDQQ